MSGKAPQSREGLNEENIAVYGWYTVFNGSMLRGEQERIISGEPEQRR